MFPALNGCNVSQSCLAFDADAGGDDEIYQQVLQKIVRSVCNLPRTFIARTRDTFSRYFPHSGNEFCTEESLGIPSSEVALDWAETSGHSMGKVRRKVITSGEGAKKGTMTSS